MQQPMLKPNERLGDASYLATVQEEHGAPAPPYLYMDSASVRFQLSNNPLRGLNAPSYAKWATLISALAFVTLLSMCHREVSKNIEFEHSVRNLSAGEEEEVNDPAQSQIVDMCLDLLEENGHLKHFARDVSEKAEVISQIVASAARYESEARRKGGPAASSVRYSTQAASPLAPASLESITNFAASSQDHQNSAFLEASSTMHSADSYHVGPFSAEPSTGDAAFVPSVPSMEHFLNVGWQTKTSLQPPAVAVPSSAGLALASASGTNLFGAGYLGSLHDFGSPERQLDESFNAALFFQRTQQAFSLSNSERTLGQLDSRSDNTAPLQKRPRLGVDTVLPAPNKQHWGLENPGGANSAHSKHVLLGGETPTSVVQMRENDSISANAATPHSLASLTPLPASSAGTSRGQKSALEGDGFTVPTTSHVSEPDHSQRGAAPSKPLEAHPFYRLPTLRGGVETIFRFKTAFLNRRELYASSTLAKMFDLFRRASLDADEASELISLAELAAHILHHSHQSSMERKTPVNKVHALGQRYLLVESLLCAIEVIGPPMQAELWWSQLMEAIPTDISPTWASKTRWGPLAMKLSNALAMLKNKIRPSPAETVALKTELLCSENSPFGYKKPAWRPWCDALELFNDS